MGTYTKGVVSIELKNDVKSFLHKQRLTPSRIKDFMDRENIAKGMHGVDDKKILIEVSGKKHTMDVNVMKEALKDFGYVEQEVNYPHPIESIRKINVIKSGNNIIINGTVHDRNTIILTNTIYINNKSYNIQTIDYLVINGIYKNNSELVKYLTNTYSKKEFKMPNKLTKLEQALMVTLPELSPYRELSSGSKIKSKLKDTNLYTISLEVEDLLGIIDVLIESYIPVDYSRLVFTRSSRFPVSYDTVTNDSILHGVKHPYLSVEWICDNLQRYFIDNSGEIELFKKNHLIKDSKDLTYNRYDGFTLEESLVLLLFNLDNMINMDGYAYIDIPTVIDNEGSVYNSTYRFILVHGLVKSYANGNESKVVQIPRNIPNNIFKDNNCMICTNELELVSNIALVMGYDLVFIKILEIYNHILDTFIDKTQLFRDHVLEFDIDSTSLKINIKEHIFKYRYLEAQEVLVDDVDVDEIGVEDSVAINDYILTREHKFKEKKKSKW